MMSFFTKTDNEPARPPAATLSAAATGLSSRAGVQERHGVQTL